MRDPCDDLAPFCKRFAQSLRVVFEVLSFLSDLLFRTTALAMYTVYMSI